LKDGLFVLRVLFDLNLSSGQNYGGSLNEMGFELQKSKSGSAKNVVSTCKNGDVACKTGI